MTSHLRDYHLVSLHSRFNKLRSDHEDLSLSHHALQASHNDLSSSHHEHDSFVHFEISNNIVLPPGYRSVLSVGPDIELIEDELNDFSLNKFIVKRPGHQSLWTHGRFGDKNDEAKLQVNVHDVAGNPQVRYTAELPPTRAERDYQITTRELEAGQYIQLEIENIDTNNITFLGRQTDASGFQIVNSEFIIARTYGSGT